VRIGDHEIVVVGILSSSHRSHRTVSMLSKGNRVVCRRLASVPLNNSTVPVYLMKVAEYNTLDAFTASYDGQTEVREPLGDAAVYIQQFRVLYKYNMSVCTLHVVIKVVASSSPNLGLWLW